MGRVVTPEEEERRGHEAQQILSNPIYRESWEAIKDRIVQQLTSADLPDDKRKRLNDLLVSHAKAKQYMEQVVVSGKMAVQEIEKQRGLVERMTERARRWA
jgi:hypothetical protein